MRKFRVGVTVSVVAMVLAAVACTAPVEEAKAPPKQPVGVEEKAPSPPPKVPEVTKKESRCVGAVEDGEAVTLSLSNGKWVRSGSTLTWSEGESDNTLRIGVVADIKEATPENGANAAVFAGVFKEEKVDLILIAGDVSEKAADIETAVGWFAKGGLPVGVIIGNREGIGAYEAAMGRLTATYPNVINLHRIRRIDTPHGDVISLPGYYDPNYLHADDGCHYTASDVEGLATLKAACDSPVILISHGGPAQSGGQALDRTSEGANVGDPKLASALGALGIRFGIFGNVHEAGGRGTDLKGKKLAPGKPHDALYLNPGPLDSVRWVMNDQSESTGMAAVFTLEGAQATYRILRRNQGE